MKLKFLRNVAVYAEHREQGSIHDIADKDAVLLIADRAAVRAGDTDPEPKPETDSEPSGPAKKSAK